MVERLALPNWNTPPRTLTEWVAALTARGHEPQVVRDEDGDIWLEIAPSRLRGLVEVEADRVESIHFELKGPDPARVLKVLDEVARGLGWELYEEDEDDVEDSSEI
jgi:hypothetical protein